MTRFRKKPVIIEAFQMTEERRWDNNDWPEWLNKAWNFEPCVLGSLAPCTQGNLLKIMTLKGVRRVEWNDWIIQGVQGELYRCKPDIFEQTYEAVD